MSTLKSLLASLYAAGMEAESLRQRYTEEGRTQDVIENVCLELQHAAENVDTEIRALRRHGQEV